MYPAGRSKIKSHKGGNAGGIDNDDLVTKYKQRVVDGAFEKRNFPHGHTPSKNKGSHCTKNHCGYFTS